MGGSIVSLAGLLFGMLCGLGVGGGGVFVVFFFVGQNDHETGHIKFDINREKKSYTLVIQ